jgi:hypothetical protein
MSTLLSHPVSRFTHTSLILLTRAHLVCIWKLVHITLCEVTMFLWSVLEICGPGRVVGIATGYGLDGPGIESRKGRDFLHLSRPALGPTQPPIQRVPGLSRGKEWPGRDADPSPPSSAAGHEIIELYLYFPYEPYGLYRSSVPVQGCNLPYLMGKSWALLSERSKLSPFTSSLFSTHFHLPVSFDALSVHSCKSFRNKFRLKPTNKIRTTKTNFQYIKCNLRLHMVWPHWGHYHKNFLVNK